MISVSSIKKPEQQQSIDLVLCSLLAFITPFKYFDLLGYSLGFPFEIRRTIEVLCIARLIWIVAFNSNYFNKIISKSIFVTLFIIITYALILTLIQPDIVLSIRNINASEVYDLIFRRGVKYIAYVFIIIYFSIALKTKKSVHLIISWLIAGFCIAEVLGLVQLVLFQITGTNLFPLVRLRSDTRWQDIAVVNIAGSQVLRVNSIANEPKALGVLLSCLLIFKFYWQGYRYELESKISRLLNLYMNKTFLLTPIIIALTFSWSGIVSLFSAVVLIALNYFYFKDKIILYCRNFMLNTKFLIIFISLVFLILNAESISAFAEVFLERRGSDIAEDRITLEKLYNFLDPEDGAVLYNIYNNPDLLLSGLGFGAYSNLSIDFVTLYYGFKEKIASPFSTNILIETIFSVGVPGLLLLLSFYKKISKTLIQYQNNFFTFIIINNIIVINFLVRTHERTFFVVLGILLSIYIIETRKSSFTI